PSESCSSRTAGAVVFASPMSLPFPAARCEHGLVSSANHPAPIGITGSGDGRCPPGAAAHERGRLPEVRRVEALREFPEPLAQNALRLGTPLSSPQQPTQADRRAQLEGLRLLPPRDVTRSQEALLGPRTGRRRRRASGFVADEQLAPHAQQLRLEVVLA